VVQGILQLRRLQRGYIVTGRSLHAAAAGHASVPQHKPCNGCRAAFRLQ
jgi:hypothetical protein